MESFAARPARAKTVFDLAQGVTMAAIACTAILAILALPVQAREDQPAGAAHSKMHAQGAPAKKAPPKGASPGASAEPGTARTTPETPASEPPPPYEPQILRLAEILGALSYLDELCGLGAAGEWRAKMQALLEAEARTTFRKERLAGTFNRSFRGYERSYRACTPNAQAIITRFLAEGGRLAREVANRYSAS